MLRIKLVKSTIGHTSHNRAVVRALGLRKMHQVVHHEDKATIRGMVHHVKDLLHVQEVSAEEASAAKKPAKAAKAAKPAKTPEKAAKTAKAAKPAKESEPKAAKPRTKKADEAAPETAGVSE